MKDEVNSNILNGILNIININENQIQKKNKTSYYKFFISHKPLKNSKSTSLNNINTQKDIISSNLPGYLDLKDLENSKYNYKKYFIKNKSNKIQSQNNSINKYKTINNGYYIKKKSSLPYLYRNLHKNVSNKHLNLQRKKMNSTDFDKFQINNKNDISFFSENLKNNNFISKNDRKGKDKEYKDYKLVNNKLKLIYNKTKYNKSNKGIIKNNKDEKMGYSINKIDLGSFLKKNNSDIFFSEDINEKLLSDRTIKKEKENKNIKNNNYLNKKKDLEIKNKNKYNSKTVTNNFNNNKEQENNLLNNKIKLNIKNGEKVAKISKLNIINDKSKENIIIKKEENKNNIIKIILSNNNSKSNLSLDEREILPYNIKECESERKEENDIKNDLILNEEQEKIFNTNQKNFFKFRKDIKEEPDLEGEEDLD